MAGCTDGFTELMYGVWQRVTVDESIDQTRTAETLHNEVRAKRLSSQVFSAIGRTDNTWGLTENWIHGQLPEWCSLFIYLEKRGPPLKQRKKNKSFRSLHRLQLAPTSDERQYDSSISKQTKEENLVRQSSKIRSLQAVFTAAD